MPPNIAILKNKHRDFLDARCERQAQVDSGELPEFPVRTSAPESEWQVSARSPSTPGSCLAGIEGYREARVWADRFRRRDPDVGSGLVLRVDSLWAAFELDDIVYELRDFVTALHCDHDGFLFSFIRTFHRFPEFVLPDRADMTLETHFLRSFSHLVRAVAERRGLSAAGDVDTEPPLAGDARVAAADLLLVPRGRITERGLRDNIGIALRFLCQDWTTEPPPAATAAAELARAQLWQWVRHATGVLDEGRIVTAELFRELLDEEASRLDGGRDAGGAAARLAGIVLGESFTMHGFCEPPA